MIKQITKTIYLLTKVGNGMYNNTLTYLIIDDSGSILIEPGNLSDFKQIYDDLKSLIDPKTIRYVVISHPDPDLTASLPLFDKLLGTYEVITEWRTKGVLSSYDLNLSFYLTKENHNQIKLESGRELLFIPTPFAHYAGSFMTYDKLSRILFSGDIFGAIYHPSKIFADDDYIEPMSIFHENYMPSSDFLRPVMKQLLNMDIKLIAPQHGALIKNGMIEKVILYLHNLDFYNTIKPYITNTTDIEEIDFYSRLVQVVIRLRQIFSDQEILEVFENTKIQLSLKPVKIDTELKHYPLWHRFFDIIYAKKGDSWLNALETLVSRISRVYKLDQPQIYQLRLRELEEMNKSFEKKVDVLQSSMEDLSAEISNSQDQLLRCPITDLYRKEMARRYIKENIAQLINKAYLINIDIDQIMGINQEFSSQTGDDTLLMLKYILSNNLESHELLFRGQGASFLLLVQSDQEKLIVQRAEFFRNLVSKSDQFVKQITISMGLIALKAEGNIHPSQLVNDWFALVESRLQMAKKVTNGTIVYNEIDDTVFYKNNLLLVDEEQVNINLITQYMEHEGYRVYHALNPFEAVKIIERHRIDIIISEINLAKLDGFALKKNLNDQTKYANIPFIFLSHMKNESLIERANRLNVTFFLKKPFYMVELLGLVKRSIR